MHEHSNEYVLQLVGGPSPITARAVVTVRDWTEHGLRNRVCAIALTWPGHVFDATSHSVYHAFQDLRLRLEPLGLTPNCYGACADVRCSGMQLDMGDGTIAYRMSATPPGGHPPSVNIFETEPGLQLATVAQQRSYTDPAAPPAARATLMDRLSDVVSALAAHIGRKRERPPLQLPSTHTPSARARGSLRPSLRRIIALSSTEDVPATVEALSHGLLAAIQEIAVLKEMMREKGVWDDAAYRRLRTEIMIQDHNTAGPFPHTSHTYFPFMLDEDEFLRFAFKATKEDLEGYNAAVQAVNHLT